MCYWISSITKVFDTDDSSKHNSIISMHICSCRHIFQWVHINQVFLSMDTIICHYTSNCHYLSVTLFTTLSPVFIVLSIACFTDSNTVGQFLLHKIKDVCKTILNMYFIACYKPLIRSYNAILPFHIIFLHSENRLLGVNKVYNSW